MTEKPLDPKRLTYLERLLLVELRLSIKAAQNLINRFGEEKVQRHAMTCLYLLNSGHNIRLPAAWLTASLTHDWQPPPDMAADWKPTVLRFRVDENTFAQFTRILRDDEKAN